MALDPDTFDALIGTIRRFVAERLRPLEERVTDGWAHATRDNIRAAVRDSGARRVHLFMSAPAGAALLLGHIWNRVGTTIVYEDPSPGYVAMFEFPG